MRQVALFSLILFFTLVNASAEEKILDTSDLEKIPVEFRQDENPDNNTISITTTVRGPAQAMLADPAHDIPMQHSRNAPMGFGGEPTSDSFSSVYPDEKVLDTSEPEKTAREFRRDQNPDNNTISITTTVRKPARTLSAD